MLGCRCSSGAVLQEVSAALCFGTLLPATELLGLLGPFLPHLWKLGLVLPILFLTGEFFLATFASSHSRLRAQQGWLGRAALRAECSSLRSGAGLCCFTSAHPCSSTWSRARLFAASCFPAGAVRLGARHRAHLGAFSHCCPQPAGAAPNLGLFTCLGTSSCCWHLWRRWSS